MKYDMKEYKRIRQKKEQYRQKILEYERRNLTVQISSPPSSIPAPFLNSLWQTSSHWSPTSPRRKPTACTCTLRRRCHCSVPRCPARLSSTTTRSSGSSFLSNVSVGIFLLFSFSVSLSGYCVSGIHHNQMWVFARSLISAIHLCCSCNVVVVSSVFILKNA